MPIIQQASVDYIDDPARTNAIILDAVAAVRRGLRLDLHRGHADYGVETIKNDGLVANGPDGVMGKFDLDRVNELIELADADLHRPRAAPPKEGVTAEDIVTNEFIDESIGL